MTLPEMQIISHRDLNSREARAITERIKSAMGDLMAEVVKAWDGRAWMALGYESWADYIKGEFNHAPLSLPRAERRAVTSLLRGQGMSTRAIGAATGVDHTTVGDDLAATGGNPPVGESTQVNGLDGRVRDYTVTCPSPKPVPSTTPEAVQPTPPTTVTCPTCGGTGRITQ